MGSAAFGGNGRCYGHNRMFRLKRDLHGAAPRARGTMTQEPLVVAPFWGMPAGDIQQQDCPICCLRGSLKEHMSACIVPACNMVRSARRTGSLTPVLHGTLLAFVPQPH